MKIEYRKGDLLKTDIPHILHGCNCQGVMGSGVAKAVREAYPKAYEDYRMEYDSHGLELGGMVLSYQVDGTLVINALTQDRYGRDGKQYVSYWAVANVFHLLNFRFKNIEIAMPRIGAGLGGGDWNVITKIIESESKNFQPVVYNNL